MRLSADGLSTDGPIAHVYDGWQYPENWDVESFSQEGPKMSARDGWFYMTLAEGGTAGPPTGHMVVSARSRSIHGRGELSVQSHRGQSATRWWSRGRDVGQAATVRIGRCITAMSSCWTRPPDVRRFNRWPMAVPPPPADIAATAKPRGVYAAWLTLSDNRTGLSARAGLTIRAANGRARFRRRLAPDRKGARRSVLAPDLRVGDRPMSARGRYRSRRRQRRTAAVLAAGFMRSSASMRTPILHRYGWSGGRRRRTWAAACSCA